MSQDGDRITDDRGNEWEYRAGRWWRLWLSYTVEHDPYRQTHFYLKPDPKSDGALVDERA